MALKEPLRYSEILSPRNLIYLKSCEGYYQTAPLVIAISHRNQPELLIRALKSALQQSLIKRRVAQIVILDDQSDCLWLKGLEDDVLHHPSITILEANCGSPSKSRNMILDWADTQDNISWVARLDADDEFFCSKSLEALYIKTQNEQIIAVVGSNALRKKRDILPDKNIASTEVLLNPNRLVPFVDGFCNGHQQQELPSCNLLLKTHSGIRYPDIRSAEDHWLLLRLLLLHADNVSVVPHPLYSIYSLDGKSTSANKSGGDWNSSRKKLAWVADKVQKIQLSKNKLLGFGMEGVVYRNKVHTIKEFYPWAMNDNEVSRLRAIMNNKSLPIPAGKWRKTDKGWSFVCTYIYDQNPGQFIHREKLIAFLEKLYRNQIVTLNIKRDNLMFTQTGELHYIDIGKDIQVLTTSYFLDVCARLYAIGILGYSDEEIVRRKSKHRPDEVLTNIPGFSKFYHNLIKSLHPVNSITCNSTKASELAANITLLIKACAQDARGFYQQIEHIVSHLSYPVRFKKKLILIDDYPGPFLRQHTKYDLESLLNQAAELKNNRIVDEILLAPNSPISIEETYQKWFGTGEVIHTHTSSNAPLYPHIWAFSRIDTRYVLQCDCDVLIGRKDLHHDFLHDMLNAIKPEPALCVGFNIPKATHEFSAYHGEPGQFAPEVRFGLLDMEKIKKVLPITNPVVSGQFQLTWHRSLQRFQHKSRFYTSLRGGDPDSFYIHPCNTDKSLLVSGIIRDLISQGLYPEHQNEKFDLVADAGWHYPKRSESVIFLMKGRFTPPGKYERCLKSLEKQGCQDFGLIVIDDASGVSHTWHYPKQLARFEGRYTLVRNNQHKGHIHNFLTAADELCGNPESLIIVLDQDDFLMQETIVEQLKNAKLKGHDLIQLPMFRPNKPLKLYRPDYENPRNKRGGNTWAHLRAFSKKLFDKIPLDYLQRSDGHWFDTATDYATMLPMAELAENPIFLDSGYAYWHEREAYSSQHKEKQKILLDEIMIKSSLLP